MNRNAAHKRPWLAAGLALLVVGLGHVYLRRWGRAFGWLGVLFVSTLLFGPESTGDASFRSVAPVVLVGAMSVVDAYAIAHRHNVRSQVDATERCPSCYRELDADLSFCPWCGTERSLSLEQRHAIEDDR